MSDRVPRWRLIVFDLDGTLVDSRRDLAESANQVLVESGGAPHSEEAVGRMVGEGAATLVARVFAAAHATQPPGALARFLEIYNSRLLRFTREYPGITETLSFLAARATLALLTNKPVAATQQILDGLALAKYFGPRVLGGDGPLPRKPDPAGLVHFMASGSATASETLMVGDSAIDWQTARAAGIRICLARYGFGFESIATAELAADDLLIDTPRALVSLVAF